MVTNTDVIACTREYPGGEVSPRGQSREDWKGTREGTHADDGVEDGSDGRDDGHDAAADGCAPAGGRDQSLEWDRDRKAVATNRQRWMQSVCRRERVSSVCLHCGRPGTSTHGRADDAHGGWIREGEGVGRGTVLRPYSGGQPAWPVSRCTGRTFVQGLLRGREGKEQQTGQFSSCSA